MRAAKGTFACLDSGNVFHGTQFFAANPSQALDYSGTVELPEVKEDQGSAYVYRAAAATEFLGGSNGHRGDDVGSDEANSGGATFGSVHATFVEDGGGFKGKGSIHGYYHRGILGPNVDDAYGELGGAVIEVSNERRGGLVEAAELKLNVKRPGRTAALVAVVDAEVDSGDYWTRGHWIISAGSHKADEGILISGSGGWKDYLSAENPGGQNVFRIDGDGKMHLGGASIVPQGTNVVFGDHIEARGLRIGDAIFSKTDSGSYTQMIRFGSGDPNGRVAAAPGSLFLNAGGGDRLSLWVKESGTGMEGWVGK